MDLVVNDKVSGKLAGLNGNQHHQRMMTNPAGCIPRQSAPGPILLEVFANTQDVEIKRSWQVHRQY